MNMDEKQRRLEELSNRYPEFNRVIEMMIPYSAIIFTNTDIERWFEELEAMLIEGKETFGKRKIINTRFLYCDIPVEIDPKLYDKWKEEGDKIPRFWRRAKILNIGEK